MKIKKIFLASFVLAVLGVSFIFVNSADSCDSFAPDKVQDPSQFYSDPSALGCSNFLNDPRVDLSRVDLENVNWKNFPAARINEIPPDKLTLTMINNINGASRPELLNGLTTEQVIGRAAQPGSTTPADFNRVSQIAALCKDLSRCEGVRNALEAVYLNAPQLSGAGPSASITLDLQNIGTGATFSNGMLCNPPPSMCVNLNQGIGPQGGIGYRLSGAAVEALGPPENPRGGFRVRQSGGGSLDSSVLPALGKDYTILPGSDGSTSFSLTPGARGPEINLENGEAEIGRRLLGTPNTIVTGPAVIFGPDSVRLGKQGAVGTWDGFYFQNNLAQEISVGIGNLNSKNYDVVYNPAQYDGLELTARGTVTVNQNLLNRKGVGYSVSNEGAIPINYVSPAGTLAISPGEIHAETSTVTTDPAPAENPSSHGRKRVRRTTGSTSSQQPPPPSAPAQPPIPKVTTIR